MWDYRINPINLTTFSSDFAILIDSFFELSMEKLKPLRSVGSKSEEVINILPPDVVVWQ
jgi:hypothetical protein